MDILKKLFNFIRGILKYFGQLKILNKYADLLRAFFERKLHRKAQIKPFELLEVDPNAITLKNKEEFHSSDFLMLAPVVGGDWDLDVKPLEQYDLYYSLLDHFEANKNWEDTDFYERVKKEFNESEDLSKWGCSSFQQFEKRLNRLDELYEVIQSEGYKTQRRLKREGSDLFGVDHKIVPEKNEIKVHIGRDGKFILADGRHRLTIAQSLEISRVPVRVNIRHKKWQAKRIKAKKGVLKDSKYIKHPDISNIK